MKYLKIVYGILILGIVVAWGIIFFKKRSGKTSTDNSKTEITIDSKVIDIGKTKHNKPVEVSFVITNIGKAPLKITNITTDCNCTIPDWDHTAILPNKTTNVKLVYNAAGLGYFQKKALVTCNVDNSPIVLILRGYVITDSISTE